jgi:dUTPase
MHNLIGVIDEHYSEELMFAGQYIPDINSMGHDLTVKFSDSIGQIIPVRREEMKVELISNKEYDDFRKEQMVIRRGGFGSTDSE